MDVGLVILNNKPCAVGVDIYAFPVTQDGTLEIPNRDFLGPEDLARYNEAAEFAIWAWENQIFDEVIYNYYKDL